MGTESGHCVCEAIPENFLAMMAENKHVKRREFE